MITISHAALSSFLVCRTSVLSSLRMFWKCARVCGGGAADTASIAAPRTEETQPEMRGEDRETQPDMREEDRGLRGESTED